MKARKVTCKCCNGTGKRDLTAVERSTIQAVGSEWSTTDQIARRLRDIQGYTTKNPALCNRLVDLHALGLVQRRAASGKHSEWRAA